MAVDFKSIGKFEQGALIAGGLAIIVSFIGSYVTASYDGPGGLDVSNGTNAWTSYATLGILLIVVSTAVVGVKAFAKESLPAGAPWSLIAAATAGVGTILLILRAVFNGGPDVAGVSVGPGWSGYVLFVAGIALTIFTALSFRESGEKIPEFNKGGANPAPHAGPTPPTAPPAVPPAPPAAGPTDPPTPPPGPPSA